MANQHEPSIATAFRRTVSTRRRLLKSLVAGGGVAASGAWVPESWTRPVIESVLLPAHAQTTADNVCMNTSTGNAEFAFTGEPQDFEVPAGVCSLTVTLNGAGGAGGNFISTPAGGGGAGEQITDTIAVTPLETLTIIVGGGGATGVLNSPGGFGGGSGGDGEAGTDLGGGGGGASSVRRGGDILLEAGGGGGGAGEGGILGSPGGNGGGTNGGTGGTSLSDGDDAGNGNGASGSPSNVAGIGGDNGSVEINW